RNDVVDDRVLERRPVLPRRIVWVATLNAPALGSFECHEHGAAPPFDEARTDTSRRRRADRCTVVARRQCLENPLDEPARLDRFLESHGDSGCDVALSAQCLHWNERGVGLTRLIDPKIERLPACTAREARETQACCERRPYGAGAVEAVAHAFVVGIDVA